MNPERERELWQRLSTLEERVENLVKVAQSMRAIFWTTLMIVGMTAVATVILAFIRV